MSAAPDPDLPMLRHTVATLAYRAAKALRGAPESFADFKASASSRTPVQILAHMGDLFDWALTMADGKAVWKDAAPLPWEREVARFFAALERFDARLAEGKPLANPSSKIFAGPIADALTHTGQINFLRRMSGAPVKGESYFRADIEAGRVGQDQAPPKVEFD
jgi:hypothetical protein